MCLSSELKTEFLWQVNNLKLRNGKSMVASKPHRKVAESFFKYKKQTLGSKLEAKDQINVLELNVKKFKIMIFTKVFLSLFHCSKTLFSASRISFSQNFF